MIKIFLIIQFFTSKNGGISKYFCRLFNDLKKFKDINIYAPIIINENLPNLVKEKYYLNLIKFETMFKIILSN